MKYYVIGGGTMVHVAPHFSLCAPAYGTIAKKIAKALREKGIKDVIEVYTKMVDSESDIETNEDLSKFIDKILEDKETKCIVLSAAICDFEPKFMSWYTGELITEVGKKQPRLSSDNPPVLALKSADKIVKKIREKRKDIFLVSFKTTTGKTHSEVYAEGLKSLKINSSNLVIANDIHNNINFIVTPEEFGYTISERSWLPNAIAGIINARSNLTYTRTKVIDYPRVSLTELDEKKCIPHNFVVVLKHLINRGAFKTFRGRTSGHFGCKVELQPYKTISSPRKENHNLVFETGMIPVFGYEEGKIVVGTHKASVGEHTQLAIYNTLRSKVDSIVHVHCPFKSGKELEDAIREQWPYECGSKECADNTISGMREFAPGIWAVHLDCHGPNIAFHHSVDAQKVIDFIEEYWDLSDKTGGVLNE